MAVRKILVVDDEPDIVTVVSKILEVRGYQVITAASGQEGFKKAKEEKPDLILLDILMPEMNGDEVYSELLKYQDTKDIPVIIFSASQKKDLEEKCIALGVTDFVKKPFEADHLLKVINNKLEGL